MEYIILGTALIVLGIATGLILTHVLKRWIGRYK